MTVALVDISTHLGFDSYSAQWIISSYIVTFGGYVVLSSICLENLPPMFSCILIMLIIN